jgi:PIN domain nuclease of toxin-antitoxin system
MRLLLDTHTFLWFVNDNLRLSDHLKDLIEDENNTSYLSLASLWEMSIKSNLGKSKWNKISDDELERVNLRRDRFQGNWNYSQS